MLLLVSGKPWGILQSNKKTDEGGHHVDRDAQFEYINQTALSYMEEDAPVISVESYIDS